jgi:GTPase SAR1 family protein
LTEQTEPAKTVLEMAEEELTEKVIAKILDGLTENGKLMVIGLGGTGKTNLVMQLVRYLMDRKEYKEGKYIIRICDSVGVWRWKFDKVPFIDLTKTRNMPENEKTLLLDLGFSDTDLNTGIIENLVRGDFHRQREMMVQNQGQLPIERIYVIEEAQNVLQSGKQSKFWLKMLSESRNYGQYFIFIGQRLADISTRACERAKWCILGAVSGDNDEAKLKRMFGKKGKSVVEMLSGLKCGEFLFIDRENPESVFKIYFPKFVQNGQPYEYDKKLNGRIKVEREFLP